MSVSNVSLPCYRSLSEIVFYAYSMSLFFIKDPNFSNSDGNDIPDSVNLVIIFSISFVAIFNYSLINGESPNAYSELWYCNKDYSDRKSLSKVSCSLWVYIGYLARGLFHDMMFIWGVYSWLFFFDFHISLNDPYIVGLFFLWDCINGS